MKIYNILSTKSASGIYECVCHVNYFYHTIPTNNIYYKLKSLASALIVKNFLYNDDSVMYNFKNTNIKYIHCFIYFDEIKIDVHINGIVAVYIPFVFYPKLYHLDLKTDILYCFDGEKDKNIFIRKLKLEELYENI